VPGSRTHDAHEVGERLVDFRSLHTGERLEYVTEISTVVDERIRHDVDVASGTIDVVWSSVVDAQLELIN
jgi:hypothetical protein